MTAGQRVALIYQPFREETHIAARHAAAILESRNVQTDLLQAFDLQGVPTDPFRFAVTFGGDGTALRAAAWLVDADIAIVPIRMGKLSFLGEIDPADLPDALPKLVDDEYWIDERTMLEARCGEVCALALNDAVVGRGAASRAVRLDVYVDDELLARYTCDGIVVSTATGSTAYALAAGGPVLMPSLRGMLLVPIAPHLTHLRSLVIPHDSRVRIVVHTVQPAVLTADGHLDLPVQDEDEVQVRMAKQTTKFARLGLRSAFYRSLEARLLRRE